VAGSKGRGRASGSSPRLSRERGPRRTPIAKSTIGRPRALTDRQVEIILFEHSRRLAWKAFGASLKSQRELARELGVSRGTVSHVVRILGRYKQVSPERRARAIKRRTGNLARLRARGLL
jgi:hypothetical protein